ncbi:MAG TPA: hypothetical protein VFG19_16510 [Geobacteraceae bacterium]|nr:hypothetical protein [Geobacteraceae bacterium]
MNISNISTFDRVMARMCGFCPACRYARGKRNGIVFRLVRYLESGICPFCRAYKKVHGG